MTCPYCRSAAAETVETKNPLQIAGLENLTIAVVRCKGCDLYYSTPLPERFNETLATFFEDSWETDHRLDVMDAWLAATWRAEPVWASAARRLKRMVVGPALAASRNGEGLRLLLDRPPATLLDIGTSYGGFVRSARFAGIEAYGTDPHHGLVRRIKALGVDYISQGVFGANAGPLGRYDALTFLSVADHFPYITPVFFQSCAALLNPGGQAVICDVDPTLQFVRDGGVLKSSISFSYFTVEFMKRAAAAAALAHSWRRCQSEPMYIFHILTKPAAPASAPA